MEVIQRANNLRSHLSHSRSQTSFLNLLNDDTPVPALSEVCSPSILHQRSVKIWWWGSTFCEVWKPLFGCNHILNLWIHIPWSFGYCFSLLEFEPMPKLNVTFHYRTFFRFPNMFQWIDLSILCTLFHNHKVYSILLGHSATSHLSLVSTKFYHFDECMTGGAHKKPLDTNLKVPHLYVLHFMVAQIMGFKQ